MRYSLSNIEMKNYLVASSSPLTESVERIKCCYEAGFAAAILKSAADYKRSGTGYGRKVVYTNDGYYADASSEHEILTLNEGLKLYETALKSCPSDILLIPSISASSLNPEEWSSSCREFEKLGAKLIQLDFFYLGTLIQDETFYDSLQSLLKTLNKKLNCYIMPKLNCNFDSDKICKVLKESGISTISLLDSMRAKFNDKLDKLGLHKETTSYFGHHQFQCTVKYLETAKKYGLEVCAGGGITSKKDIEYLLKEGADMIQVASYILNRNFESVKDLLEKDFSSKLNSNILKHNPWCDTEDGATCKECGACKHHILI